MDGFVRLVQEIVRSEDLSANCIHNSSSLELPGYFRFDKKGDLIVVVGDVLVAAIEL